jgi:hypothetical protein
LGNIISRENKFEKRINILAANKVDKGKSTERLRRKAMGLRHQKCKKFTKLIKANQPKG